jgi:hypothetical protein
MTVAATRPIGTATAIIPGETVRRRPCRRGVGWQSRPIPMIAGPSVRSREAVTSARSGRPDALLRWGDVRTWTWLWFYVNNEPVDGDWSPLTAPARRDRQAPRLLEMLMTIHTTVDLTAPGDPLPDVIAGLLRFLYPTDLSYHDVACSTDRFHAHRAEIADAFRAAGPSVYGVAFAPRVLALAAMAMARALRWLDTVVLTDGHRPVVLARQFAALMGAIDAFTRTHDLAGSLEP